jgi:hypothetical protein
MAMPRDGNDPNHPTRNFSKVSPEPSPNERKIAERIARLLSHYWTPDDDPAIRSLQAVDWIEDLVEFPIDIVEHACQQWRRNEHRRPIIADIRKLAGIELLRRERRERDEQRKLQDLSQTTEILQRCKDLYGACSGRYAKLGVVCYEECKAKVPNYAGNHATWAD